MEHLIKLIRMASQVELLDHIGYDLIFVLLHMALALALDLGPALDPALALAIALSGDIDVFALEYMPCHAFRRPPTRLTTYILGIFRAPHGVFGRAPSTGYLHLDTARVMT
jgi:hypothetical protein